MAVRKLPFLLEIGSEEIPDWMILGALESLRALATAAVPAPARSEGELPFDAASPLPRTWSPRDLPALDDEFDERTPMLARAFESLRQHEERRPDTATGPDSSSDPGIS